MRTTLVGTDDFESGEQVLREMVGQMAIAAPLVGAIVVVVAFALGGSPPVLVSILAVGSLTLIPAFRRYLPVSPHHVIGAWFALIASSASLLALRAETYTLAAVLGAATILGTRVVVQTRIRVMILVSVIAVQALGLWAIGPLSERAWALAALLVLAVGVENLSARHRLIHRGSERRVQQLQVDRGRLVQLYEIASSIGASTTVQEAMPDLLGSVGQVVGVRTCAVLRSDAEGDRMRLMGPVWLDGTSHPVEEDISVEVAEGNFCSRVLRSSRPIRVDRRTAGPMRRVLDCLGIESGMVGPIRLEGLASGVIIVGDPAGDGLEDGQLDLLGQVASPVGLVLAQLERYEAAALLAQQMQEVAEMKTDLVAMATHELRNPLTSVIGSLDVMKRLDPTTDPELADELMTAADRQAHRLKRMIDDLLTVSRIDRGLVRPEPAVLDLGSAIEEALWVMGDIPVQVEVPSGLQVVADADHLHQILVNLIENAAKFADDGPIEIGAGPIDDHDVVIAVIDHGPGISRADRDRVFERFVQLSRGTNGSGLGLSIVRMLVEGMGGKVGVFDTPGGGATFAVRLPGTGARRPRLAALSVSSGTGS